MNIMKLFFAQRRYVCSLFISFSIALSFSANAQNIENSQQAIKLALDKVAQEVTPTTELKLEHLKATRSAKGKTWQIVFRDGEIKYIVDLNGDGKSKFKKKFDVDQNNPEFWATLPAPEQVELDTDYLSLTQNVVNKFNTTFTAQERAIIEYHVCDAPKPGTSSKYKSGCRSDKAKEWWEVIVKVKTATGESYRQVEFQNGEPVILSRVNVFGNW